MRLKNLLKKTYYSVNKIKYLPGYSFRLGFVFHTEEIFNPVIHETLIRFCKEYLQITGTKCICVTMTPPNMRIEKGMRQFGCSNQEYINRMEELSEVAHIGFHGHFWHDPAKFEDPESCIRKYNTNYDYDVFHKQFSDQINWFKENNVAHNETYSGGWWFINRDVIELLLQHGIKYDYTISKSPNLWNPFTIDMVKKNEILYGESFYTRIKNESLLHVQNLHCGQDTPFPYDATRFMNTLLEPQQQLVTGVLNSHDYCLDYDYTINWIRYLKELPQVEFLDHHDLVKSDIEKAKVVLL